RLPPVPAEGAPDDPGRERVAAAGRGGTRLGELRQDRPDGRGRPAGGEHLVGTIGGVHQSQSWFPVKSRRLDATATARRPDGMISDVKARATVAARAAAGARA